MLQAGIAVKVTIVHSFSLIYAANMSACASAGFRDTTATMLRSYAIDQTKQDNPALLDPTAIGKTIHAATAIGKTIHAAGFNLTVESECVFWALPLSSCI